MRNSGSIFKGTLAALLVAATLPAGASAFSLSGTLDSLGLSVWVLEEETAATETQSGTSSDTSSDASGSSACPSATLLRPFEAWNDPAQYKLAPGGDFEGSMTGWQLTGGAQVVAGGSPYAATGERSTRGLRLPAGATATSPAVCIEPGSPVARLFAVTRGSRSAASLGVELIDAAGEAKSAGQLPSLSSWDAGRRFSLAQGRHLRGGKDGSAQLRIRLVAGGEAWDVDDLFVDPRSLG